VGSNRTAGRSREQQRARLASMSTHAYWSAIFGTARRPESDRTGGLDHLGGMDIHGIPAATLRCGSKPLSPSDKRFSLRQSRVRSSGQYSRPNFRGAMPRDVCAPVETGPAGQVCEILERLCSSRLSLRDTELLQGRRVPLSTPGMNSEESDNVQNAARASGSEEQQRFRIGSEGSTRGADSSS
jgi:hypothetical protein